MEELVHTINGSFCKKDQCRYIDKQYYIIGDINIENSGDVYLLNDRYIRISTGKIVFNHSISQYQLKNSNVIEGAIGFNESEPIMGYFSVDPLANVTLVLANSNTICCINNSIINLNFREKRSTGVYYHITRNSVKSLNTLSVVSREYKESLQYDSHGIMEAYVYNYNQNYKYNSNKKINNYVQLMQGLSFGLEFETVIGSIPKDKLGALPLIPLRDGSIRGLEYVTIPLEGEKGFNALIDSVKELEKRTTYDDSCSLHLHIGNIPRTPEFILAFYKLVSYYQDEMFEMFPLYKKYNFGVKKKNYSQPFPINNLNFYMDKSINISDKTQVNNNFKVLFDYLSMGNPFEHYNNDLSNVNSHPFDVNGTQKWNIKTRYHAINLIPLIFGNKSTIEFRIHTPTYNINKIINFIIINASLINFAKDNTAGILDSSIDFRRLDLSRLISYQIKNTPAMKGNFKTELIHEIESYINRRKDVTYSNNSKGDIRSNEDQIMFKPRINYDSIEAPLLEPKTPRYKTIIVDEMENMLQELKSDHGYNSKKRTLTDALIDSIGHKPVKSSGRAFTTSFSFGSDLRPPELMKKEIAPDESIVISDLE